MRVLLASTYELGHQPLGLASPAAALRAAGHEVHCLDLAVEQLPGAELAQAELVGISVPMHTAARLGLTLAARIRALNPRTHLVLYGLYASALHEQLMGRGVVDAVVGGEYEPGLVRLAGTVAAGKALAEGIDGVGADPSFARGAQIVPDRRGLPPLQRYARLSLGSRGDEGSHEGDLRLVGYVEASRGCAHVCRHCPITPVYGGRLRVAAMETTLADVDQLVAMGARHITFGDPDFFNAVPRSMAIVEEMRRRHADVTFDATVKVEHLLEYAHLLPRLREFGGLFLTSAFESTNDAVLARLDKGHTRADMERALALVRDAGLTLRPTWLPFTPWGTAEDFLELLEFVERWGLVESVQPVQLALRLLIPPGSALVETVEADGLLGEYDEDGLTYTWRGVDPRTETLQAEVVAIVEGAAHAHDRRQSTLETFAAVKRAAYRAVTGVDRAVEVVSQPSAAVPGLTEAWFC